MLTCAFRVDAIKKAARREAWYHNDDPSNRTYNIYSRPYNGAKRSRDEESAPLPHSKSESDALSPGEADRIQSSREFGGPRKAESSPVNATNNRELDAFPEKADDPITSSDVSKDSAEEPAPYRQAPNEDREFPQDDETGGARKRRPWDFLKKHKEEESSGATTRSSTGSSKKKKNPNITLVSQLKVVFLSWINILLVAAPVGIALANINGIDGVVVFVVNFIAIIPLAGMLSFATEELALYVGETLGGLLNATFGNAVELIVSIIALVKQEILIVQTSLIGSMLSNLLLVLGMCFFFGGIRRTEQHFNVVVAQTAASLLALASGSLIIPTAFQIFATGNPSSAGLSRGTSVLLLVTYGCYLFFQLSTHAAIYMEESEKSPRHKSSKKKEGDAKQGIAAIGAGNGAAYAGGSINQENLVHSEGDDDEAEVPQLTKIGALCTLAGSTVLVAVCAEYMVGGIGSVTSHGVSEEFVGLILLPIVGNAAEHATAVTVAIKDKMDLAIGVAIGSSLQIALLVLPLTVMLSWWGVPGSGPAMTLSFDGFQIVVLFVAVIVVNYLIQDGKSHWLEGVLLQVTVSLCSRPSLPLRDQRSARPLTASNADCCVVPHHRHCGLVLPDRARHEDCRLNGSKRTISSYVGSFGLFFLCQAWCHLSYGGRNTAGFVSCMVFRRRGKTRSNHRG